MLAHCRSASARELRFPGTAKLRAALVAKCVGMAENSTLLTRNGAAHSGHLGSDELASGSPTRELVLYGK